MFFNSTSSCKRNYLSQRTTNNEGKINEKQLQELKKQIYEGIRNVNPQFVADYLEYRSKTENDAVHAVIKKASDLYKYFRFWICVF